MPLNKDAYLRYRIIDQCLTNSMKPFPTKEYILERVEEVVGTVSVSSLEKDFGQMKRIFKAPIEFDRYRKGYFYNDPHFSIINFPLTEEEITALDFSMGVLQVLKSTPVFSKVEGAVDKVISGYRVSKLLGKTDDELIQVESPVSAAGSQWIEAIYQAIIQKKVLAVLYQPFEKEAKMHQLSPYLLKEYRNCWYVIGQSDRAEAVLVFALDRIRDISPSSEKWIKNQEFDPHTYFKYSFGITQIHNEKPQKVVLSFTPQQANYILTQQLHPSQKIIRQNQNEVRIELNVFLTQELLMMILGYGPGVKVISPKKLVDDVREQVKTMMKIYAQMKRK